MKLFDVSSDSTCDLKKAYVEERNIHFVPLTFTMEKGSSLEEGLDNFSNHQEYVGFYAKVRAGYFPRTAKLNYQAHIDHFTKLAKAGVKEVLHFMISSGLVNVNHFEETRCDVDLSEEDMLSVRGYGRFVVKEFGSLTRKGRNRVVVHKMI